MRGAANFLRWGLVAPLIFAVLASGAVGQQISGDSVAAREVTLAWQRLQELRSYRERLTMEADLPMSFTTEVVNPDRRRTLVRIGDRTVETVVVGEEVRYLIHETEAMRRERQEQQARQTENLVLGLAMSLVFGGPGALLEHAFSMAMQQVQNAVAQSAMARGLRPGIWECPDVKPPARSADGGGASMRVSRLPDAVIEGAATRVYLLEVTAERQTVQAQVYVLVERGLPRRQVMQMAGGHAGQGRLVSDYYDYNAPIQIALPACGQRQS